MAFLCCVTYPDVIMQVEESEFHLYNREILLLVLRVCWASKPLSIEIKNTFYCFKLSFLTHANGQTFLAHRNMCHRQYNMYRRLVSILAKLLTLKVLNF